MKCVPRDQKENVLFCKQSKKLNSCTQSGTWKVMFSHASVILFTIGLMATLSLLILVTARSVRILLECFLVL